MWPLCFMGVQDTIVLSMHSLLLRLVSNMHTQSMVKTKTKAKKIQFSKNFNLGIQLNMLAKI